MLRKLWGNQRRCLGGACQQARAQREVVDEGERGGGRGTIDELVGRRGGQSIVSEEGWGGLALTGVARESSQRGRGVLGTVGERLWARVKGSVSKKSVRADLSERQDTEPVWRDTDRDGSIGVSEYGRHVMVLHCIHPRHCRYCSIRDMISRRTKPSPHIAHTTMVPVGEPRRRRATRCARVTLHAGCAAHARPPPLLDRRQYDVMMCCRGMTAHYSRYTTSTFDGVVPMMFPLPVPFLAGGFRHLSARQPCDRVAYKPM
nr:hypothetical protein CFP56_13146 [Quercus suber]